MASGEQARSTRVVSPPGPAASQQAAARQKNASLKGLRIASSVRSSFRLAQPRPGLVDCTLHDRRRTRRIPPRAPGRIQHGRLAIVCPSLPRRVWTFFFEAYDRQRITWNNWPGTLLERKRDKSGLPAVHDYLSRLDESRPLTPAELAELSRLVSSCVATSEALLEYGEGLVGKPCSS